jgi:hypothetical protein
MTETTLQAETPAEGAPALPVEAVTAETPAATDETTETTSAEAEPEGKRTPWFQKRIDELTRDKYEERRAREALQRELEFARAQRQLEPETVKAPAKLSEPPLAPTLESAGWDEAKYREEYSKFATAQAEWLRQAARAEAESLLAEREQKQAERKRAETFREREAKFIAQTPDYQEIAYRSDLPVSKEMAEVIAGSPEGPALAYYLGKNMDKAREIAALPPFHAARELGRLEAMLAVKPAAASAPKPVTKSPPPPATIEGVEPDIEKNPYDESMSINDWMAWRNKQEKRKKG